MGRMDAPLFLAPNSPFSLCGPVLNPSDSHNNASYSVYLYSCIPVFFIY
jgi:hypothetical protein